ncbi:sodium-dependent nutrient amino acid transporter 1 isoform X2 [Anabrus simplex]|uniref:sodium-dependent nutrient amino acid transporter 1 isoform X2 n=1 Tax=Anabrus simplex TaxID=316456 RepID=UPI0035A3ACA2
MSTDNQDRGVDNAAYEEDLPNKHSTVLQSKDKGVDNIAFEEDLPSKRSSVSSASTVPQGKDADDVEKGPERAQWGSGLEFLMSCIAMSVGLGNIWRFPFTAYENGGGAFLIPYIIVLVVIGKPLYYLEMALGQFTSSGCVRVWNMAPGLKGLGYGQIFGTTLILTYYCSLMALTTFYMFASFTDELPWGKCDSDWGDVCFDSKVDGDDTTNRTGRRSSSELYFLRFVLNEPANIEDGIGVPEWRLTLCLLLSWILVYLVTVRGVKSSGKAAYFLALFPYVVLIALLVRGATLPGAGDGILYFITPVWDKLLSPSVWYAAVSQAFFSLNVCFGSLIVYSSYNNFSHKIYRDAMIVTTLDTFTSLLAGCTIFSILGNLAYEMGVDDIQDVVRSGTGLAFISYPDAISKFDIVPQLFAVLFFFMLLVLGVGSAVALTGAVSTIIMDSFPHFKQWIVSTVVCVFGFFVGLVYVCPGGQYILNLVDSYPVTFVIFALACVETSAVAWIYGVDNICQDIEFMAGRKISFYWRFCWGFLTPVILIIILIYSIVDIEPLTYSGVTYPDVALIAAYILIAIGVLQWPIWIGYYMLQHRHLPFMEIVRKAFTPNAKWGPRDPKIYSEWVKFKNSRRDAEKLAKESLWKKVVRKLFGCGKLDVAS